MNVFRSYLNASRVRISSALYIAMSSYDVVCGNHCVRLESLSLSEFA